jgi:hypothetical protein
VDLATVRVNVFLRELAWADQEFEPAGATPLGSDFRPPQEIAFGDDPENAPVLIDDGQSAHTPLQHDADSLENGGIRLHRHDGRSHYVFGFHSGSPIALLFLVQKRAALLI